MKNGYIEKFSLRANWAIKLRLFVSLTATLMTAEMAHLKDGGVQIRRVNVSETSPRFPWKTQEIHIFLFLSPSSNFSEQKGEKYEHKKVHKAT